MNKKATINSLSLKTKEHGILEFTVKNKFPKDENLKIPSIGKFAQIKHDWEVYPNRMPRQFSAPSMPKYPYPAVVNKTWGLLTKDSIRVYDYVALNEEWQWFMWNFWNWASGYSLPKGQIERFYRKPPPQNADGIFAQCTPGSLTWLYANMIEDARSHTDSYSPEFGARDYVTKRNMNSKRNWEWLCRPTTGQILKVSDAGGLWEADAIDLLQSPPTMEELEEKIWLWGWATEITTVKLPNNRGYVVSDYAQIDQALKVHNSNSPRRGTPIPLLSLGGKIKISKAHCRIVENNSAWSPYNPPK